MVSRRSFLLGAVVVAGAVASALPASAQPPQKLFFIQRSKNADEVHYDAKLNADGSLATKDPVDGYWMNKGADGSFFRAELSFFQKKAYGWDTESTPNGSTALKLTAFKDRPMWIVKANGRYRVQTTIAGKQAYLSRLYVATKEGGILPTVLYVDVFGEDASSGAALTEHINKT